MTAAVRLAAAVTAPVPVVPAAAGARDDDEFADLAAESAS